MFLLKDDIRDLEVNSKMETLEEDQQDKKIKINTELLHYLSFWVLELWFVLRILDLSFSYIAITEGTGQEASPIINLLGWSLPMLLLGFLPIIGLIIVNYKLAKR